jgi:hypothetical protein
MNAQLAPPRRAPRRPVPDRGRRAWIVTLAATLASTYALDAFATMVGGALAASGLLGGLGPGPLLAVLAGTYLLWGAGLRANLAANWSLLSRTGLSTNVLSKAAHDLARSRHAGPRAQRVAASGGYLLTEAAKEVPYYAGAFGASVLSNAVTATNALVFLAGTNVGAAVYEYGAARVTRAFLQRR